MYPEKIYQFKTKIKRYMMCLMISKEVLCLSQRFFIWGYINGTYMKKQMKRTTQVETSWGKRLYKKITVVIHWYDSAENNTYTCNKANTE